MPKLILYFLYGLTDPRFSYLSATRYSGVTIHPNVRYGMHLSCPPSDPEDKNTWVRDVVTSGYEPGVEILEIYSDSNSKQGRARAKERETHWIRHYETLGANLLNSQQKGKPTTAEAIDVTDAEVWGVDEEFTEQLEKLLGEDWGMRQGAILGGESD